jgi:hypothetical protein
MIERDAILSDCGKYRYLLGRVWDHSKPRALVVMLNPSTADAYTDDATIRSLIRLLSAIGYGSFEVVNLFGFRATKPAELLSIPNPVGPDNDRIFDGAVERCDIPIVAWGAHPFSRHRAEQMAGRIRAIRPMTFCFGKTKAGHPKHPLYLKTGTQLEVWGI